jgi:hypothetical protein
MMDVYIALREAFNTAKRQVEEYARKQRGEVKTHEHKRGRITAES